MNDTCILTGSIPCGMQVLSTPALMKKMLYPPFILVLFLAVLLIRFQSQAQSADKLTKQQAAKWYKSQEWLHGLQLKPHSSTDQEEFARQYHANQPGWDKAFAFMKETDLNSLAPGRIPIDGENVYVIVTEAPGKDPDKARWESHRNYNDIHYVVKGKEKIGLAAAASATITAAYDPAKDIMFYTAEGKFHLAEPGTFFIIAPRDAHCPGIKVDGDEVVKKVVIKVRTGVEDPRN
jgi:biofilm protein TabA